MKPLSPRAQRLTRAYRDEHALPHEARARLLARLAMPSAGGLDPASSSRSVPPPRAARRWLRVLRWGGPTSLLVVALGLVPRAPSPSPAERSVPSAVEAAVLDTRAQAVAAPPSIAVSVAQRDAPPPQRARAALVSRSRAKARSPVAASKPLSDVEVSSMRAEPATEAQANGRSPLAPADATEERLEQRKVAPSYAPSIPSRSSSEAGSTSNFAPEARVRAAPRPAPALSLDDEVMLVRRASDLLRAGDPARALSALAEHARLFPSGKLVTMRRAARVQALCALGRREEARSEATRFLAQHADSPYAASVRELCASK